ncbi:MAG: hypothetical protein R2706_05675 [Acidimicrobiales bacterium]
MSQAPTCDPVVIGLLSTLAASLFVLPLLGLAVMPWGDVPGLVTSEVVVDALVVSLISSPWLPSSRWCSAIEVVFARRTSEGNSSCASRDAPDGGAAPGHGGAALLFAAIDEVSSVSRSTTRTGFLPPSRSGVSLSPIPLWRCCFWS